jgi:hypothetical protein
VHVNTRIYMHIHAHTHIYTSTYIHTLTTQPHIPEIPPARSAVDAVGVSASLILTATLIFVEPVALRCAFVDVRVYVWMSVCMVSVYAWWIYEHRDSHSHTHTHSRTYLVISVVVFGRLLWTMRPPFGAPRIVHGALGLVRQTLVGLGELGVWVYVYVHVSGIW